MGLGSFIRSSYLGILVGDLVPSPAAASHLLDHQLSGINRTRPAQQDQRDSSGESSRDAAIHWDYKRHADRIARIFMKGTVISTWDV